LPVTHVWRTSTIERVAVESGSYGSKTHLAVRFVKRIVEKSTAGIVWVDVIHHSKSKVFSLLFIVILEVFALTGSRLITLNKI
jgi:hypothetical protein